MTEASFLKILEWMAVKTCRAIWVSDRFGNIVWKSETFNHILSIKDPGPLTEVSVFNATRQENTTLKAIFEELQPWQTKELTGQLALQGKLSHPGIIQLLKIRMEWTGSAKLLGILSHQNASIAGLLEIVLEHANDAIVASDENFVITYWSKGAEKIYGYLAEFAIGKKGQDLLDTQFIGINRAEAIKQLLDTGNLRVETIQKTAQGRRIHVEVNTLAIYNDNKEIKGFVSVNRDTTARRQAEQLLAESEHRFRQFAENAADLIYRYDLLPSPHFSYVSPSAEKIIGYTPEDHYTDPSLGFKIVHPDDRHLLNYLMELKPGEIVRPMVLRWKHKDGHIIYTEQQNTPIFDAEGNLIAIEGIARDVTRQKQLEQELLLSNQLLDEAARIGNFGGWSYEADMNMFTWSPQLFEIYEFSDGVREKGLEVMRKFYSPESLKELLDLFEKAKKEGQDFTLETEITTWKNNKKWVRIAGKPTLKDGLVVRISGTVQDITQQKQTEEQLKDSRKKLRRLYQKTQGMLEMERKKISHELHDELGQLLTLVNLELSTIIKKSRSTKIRSLAGQMKSAIEMAVEIVRRVSGELHPPLLDQLGLVPALQWLLSQLSKRTKIEITTQLPDLFDIPLEYPHSIHIYRIVQESFTNILRHSEATEASLVMKREGNRLYLTIKDNGKGFKVEDLEETIHAGIAGMYDRADIMSGTLKINTIPGQGTTIDLEIPL